MIFAGLIGAILWNLVTWLLGLPSSSSHALFGGLIGAAIVGAGFGSIDLGVLLSKVVFPALLAPLTAGLVAYLATRIAYAVAKKKQRTHFKIGQIFTSSLVSLAHGTNDAQKTMGVITLTLIAGGMQADGFRARAVGHHRVRTRDRAGDVHRRLAHHPHARQGPH